MGTEWITIRERNFLSEKRENDLGQAKNGMCTKYLHVNMHIHISTHILLFLSCVCMHVRERVMYLILSCFSSCFSVIYVVLGSYPELAKLQGQRKYSPQDCLHSDTNSKFGDC